MKKSEITAITDKAWNTWSYLSADGGYVISEGAFDEMVESLVKKSNDIHSVSQRYTIEDIERCVENWGLCKVEKEYIEKFLNGG